MTETTHKFNVTRLVGIVAAAGAVLTSILSPPAFWLFGVGIALIVATALIYGLRTGVWVHTPWESTDHVPLPRLEASLGVAGVALMVAPLAVAGVRALGW